MEYKDYYKILGVDRNAKEPEIKRVYRKLALQYHPDHNPGDKKAEDKFKEINEAYQVLSDPQKRTRYDQLGESYSRWQQRGAPGGFNWEEWSNTPAGYPRGDYSSRVEYNDLEDILGGGFSEFFRRIFGDFGSQPTRGGQSTRQGRAQQPSIQKEITLTLLEAYHGATRLFDVDGKRLEIKTPPGARTGTKVRVANAIPSNANGQTGDLYLVIKVADDPRFERDGNDLYTDGHMDLYTAVLGGEITVATLNGKIVLTIPPETQPGQTFRLHGRGMPQLKNPQTRGDLFVRAKVRIPRKLTERQRELFEELARSEKSQTTSE
ncbi:MAG: J domain-containing protein [Chloroflexota bacterium]|nr:MAG: J domain-containing protein [Chloroflexota bacterium]